MIKEVNDWVWSYNPSPAAQYRLLCFPYSGGAAQVFRTWARHAPTSVELCAVQYPGRWNRLKESPHRRVATLIDAALPYIEGIMDVPCAFYGHSFGGLIAFEIARTLRKRGLALPIHLFVGARVAPDTPLERNPYYTLGDQPFMRLMAETYGGIPPAVLSSPELLSVVLPPLRADMEAFETYVYEEDEPLNIPLTAFCGAEDTTATRDKMGGWGRQTSAEFQVHTVSGGHFFIQERETEVVTHIFRRLGWL